MATENTLYKTFVVSSQLKPAEYFIRLMHTLDALLPHEKTFKAFVLDTNSSLPALTQTCEDRYVQRCKYGGID